VSTLVVLTVPDLNLAHSRQRKPHDRRGVFVCSAVHCSFAFLYTAFTGFCAGVSAASLTARST
jgi:hypothetical protein